MQNCNQHSIIDCDCQRGQTGQWSLQFNGRGFIKGSGKEEEKDQLEAMVQKRSGAPHIIIVLEFKGERKVKNLDLSLVVYITLQLTCVH